MFNKIRNSLSIDFKKVHFDEVKVTMKNVLDNFCPNSFLQHIFIYLIPLIQIYYFRAFKINSNSAFSILSNVINFPLILYGLASFSVKILFSVIEFFNEMILEIFIEYFNKKDYFKIGEYFRKIIILTELCNIIFYFPFIFMANNILNSYFINQIIDLTEFSNLIYNYQAINFFTLIFYSINKPLIHMLYCFNKVKVLTLAALIKFLINSSLCKYFSFKDYYVLNGCALAEALSEICCTIFLLSVQHFKNPFPQAWSRFTIDNLKIKDILYLFDIRKFVCFLLLDRWNEILVFLFVFLNLYDKVIDLKHVLLLNPNETLLLFKNIQILIFLSFCKDLFFGATDFTKRKTVMDLLTNFNNFIYKKKAQTELSTITKVNLKENLVKDNLEVKKENENISAIHIFKTKIYSCIYMCLILLCLYLLFYILNLHSVFFGEEIKFLDFISNSFNGIVNSLSIELYIINIQYRNINYFSTIILSFLGLSLPLFLMINYLFQSLFLVLISLYLGELLILYKFFSFIKSIDVRLINVEKLLKINENK